MVWGVQSDRCVTLCTEHMYSTKTEKGKEYLLVETDDVGVVSSFLLYQRMQFYACMMLSSSTDVQELDCANGIRPDLNKYLPYFVLYRNGMRREVSTRRITLLRLQTSCSR